MNSNLANSVSCYFDVLTEINSCFLQLCEENSRNILGRFDKMKILKIIDDIYKLLPYKLIRNEDKLKISKTDGVLQFIKHLDFLLEGYSSLLVSHNQKLWELRLLRNKYEHEMHVIKLKSYGNGSSIGFEYEFEFKYKNKDMNVNITYDDLAVILKKLNVIFLKIQKAVVDYAHDKGKEKYVYYEKINEYDFIEFNKRIDLVINKGYW